jgi:hypothetical protein
VCWSTQHLSEAWHTAAPGQWRHSKLQNECGAWHRRNALLQESQGIDMEREQQWHRHLLDHQESPCPTSPSPNPGCGQQNKHSNLNDTVSPEGQRQ